MANESQAETAIRKAAHNIGYRSTDRYAARCAFLFKELDLKGARVLDIGCGKGAFAVWAGLHGAVHVLGIEPESNGSTQGTLSVFRQTVDELDLGSIVKARPCRLEELTPNDGPFDIVILFAVINHLDEAAVVELHTSEAAAARYVSALSHLRSLMSEGGTVIVADCSRRNFWNDIGLRNPLMPTIEWHKHQQPEVWTSIFQLAGFTRSDLRWSPMYPMGRISNNRLLQYFTASDFTLRFRAV